MVPAFALQQAIIPSTYGTHFSWERRDLCQNPYLVGVESKFLKHITGDRKKCSYENSTKILHLSMNGSYLRSEFPSELPRSCRQILIRKDQRSNYFIFLWFNTGIIVLLALNRPSERFLNMILGCVQSPYSHKGMSYIKITCSWIALSSLRDVGLL